MVTTIHPRNCRRRDPIQFRPAHVAVSRGAYVTLELANCSPRTLLLRHTRADWGILRDDDARENDWALNHAAPVHSLFELPTGAQILLATDATRSLTCILLVDTDPALCDDWIIDEFARDRILSPTRSITSRPDSPLTSACPLASPVFHGPASLADILPPDRLAHPASS